MYLNFQGYFEADNKAYNVKEIIGDKWLSRQDPQPLTQGSDDQEYLCGSYDESVPCLQDISPSGRVYEDYVKQAF